MSAKSSFVWGWSNINGLDCGGIRLHWVCCTEVSEEVRTTANRVGRVFKGDNGLWSHVKNDPSAATRGGGGWWGRRGGNWWGQGQWEQTAQGEWIWRRYE